MNFNIFVISSLHIAVDTVVLSYQDKSIKILLDKRNKEPFENEWALPGVYLKNTESCEQAVKRCLIEKCGLPDFKMEQLYTFSDLNRDPRGRVISVAYYSIIGYYNIKSKKGQWFDIDNLPQALAFDHFNIINITKERLKSKIKYKPIGLNLLPEKFTFRDVIDLYSAILGKSVIDNDDRNFRKLFMKLNVLEDTGEKEKNVKRRPGKLYRFNKKEYDKGLKNDIYLNL